MTGRPRRTVPAVPVKLGADTVVMLRRIARAEQGRTPTLDDAVRQLARKAGIPPETFSIPETSQGADT
jgi:protein-disulfide isomerase-like protein with CxxC motif